MRSLTRHVMSAFVVAVLAVGGGGAHAGSVAGFGGSTEITQIMNNLELVKQVMQEAETVRNTLQSAMYLKKSLQQMDPRELARMLQRPLDEVRAMASMHDQLGGLIDSERDLFKRMGRFKDGAQSQNMTPSEYLKALSEQAAAGGEVYEKSLDADQKRIKDVQSRIDSIQATADSVPTVTSQVEGLQKLLGSNAQLQVQMLSMNEAMTKANVMAAMKGRNEEANKKAHLDHAQDERDRMQKLKDMTISLPDPSQYAPGSTH